MDTQISEENPPIVPVDPGTISTASSYAIYSKKRIVPDLSLVWIDARIDPSNKDFQNTLVQLKSIVNDVHIFTQRDEGIDFLTEIHDAKAILIVEDTIGQHTVPFIHEAPQLHAIFILCDDKAEHEQWAKQKWAKVKGIYTDIKLICEGLQQVTKQCNQDSIAMSFVTLNEGGSSQNLNQLEPSFMYTQILKEILLEIKYNNQSVKNFIQFWRAHYLDNITNLNKIIEFESDYSPQTAITWYTHEYFVYWMLNQSLRMLETDKIINMGFFIRDIHQQIVELHKKQVNSFKGKSFTVYRGQGLLIMDFKKLLKNKGGLISFNNFLSTSKDRNVSMTFAESASSNSDMTGILFEMTIDPSISSAPFASIQEVGWFLEEEEILFSMHTVFRIGEINTIDNNDSLYQVNLTLTADDDQQLRTLTKYIREEIGHGTGWSRLGQLLLQLDHCDKAEQLYNALLEQTTVNHEQALYYHQLGCTKDAQGNYTKALEYYEKAVQIRENTPSLNHQNLATSYNNIGSVYDKMGEYLQALSFHEKALELRQKILPSNHSDLAETYSNMGVVYVHMGEHLKALSYYEKALKIDQENLPANHPHLTTTYSNIAGIYRIMGEYSKALLYYEKTLEIDQKTLLPNHSNFVISYNNIGLIYDNMGEYSKALSYYEKALEICQKTLSPNHPFLAVSYNNIAGAYCIRREYPQALSFHEKAFEIRKKTLPSNHPHFVQSYNNIGLVHYKMGEYSRALLHFEKALEICREVSPENHPDLAILYKSIAATYCNRGEYSKALSYYKLSLDNFLRSPPAYHSHIQDVQKLIDRIRQIIIISDE